MSVKNVKHLDIRGLLCPMTFVYTKLALEKLKTGDLLEVLLDYRSALKNVPENCKRQGLAELLEVKVVNPKKGAEEWELLLKKI